MWFVTVTRIVLILGCVCWCFRRFCLFFWADQYIQQIYSMQCEVSCISEKMFVNLWWKEKYIIVKTFIHYRFHFISNSLPSNNIFCSSKRLTWTPKNSNRASILLKTLKLLSKYKRHKCSMFFLRSLLARFRRRVYMLPRHWKINPVRTTYIICRELRVRVSHNFNDPKKNSTISCSMSSS